MSKPVLFFDIDETLLNCKSMFSFLKFYLKNKFPKEYDFKLEEVSNKIQEKLSESLVREELGIQVHSGNQLLNLALIKNEVQTEILDIKSGKVNKKIWPCVIACDGAQSDVRNILSFETHEKKYDSYFVLADVQLNLCPEIIQNELNYFLTEEGYAILAPLPKGKFRMIFSFKGDYPGKKAITFANDKLEELFYKRSGYKVKIDHIIWNTSATFYHRLANRAFKGSVLLAGDAFHQFAPVGGTNMNVGIDDGFYLANLFRENEDNNIQDIFSQYEENRLQKIEKNREFTQWATGLMTQTGEISMIEKNLNSNLQNRKFLRQVLPNLFSGKFDFTDLKKERCLL